MQKLASSYGVRRSWSIRRILPSFLDDWLTPGVPLKRSCVYSYMRYKYLKEYALFVAGISRDDFPRTPHIRKRQLIRQYAREYDLHDFVETGTYLGDMIAALSNDFRTLHSIELFQPLYEKACVRFSRKQHIHLYFGDSRVELVKILSRLDTSALFWLDAHYSGTGTARGVEDSPIVGEIDSIFSQSAMKHVLLIDDASDFTGTGGYPKIDELRQYILAKNPNYDCIVSNNIVIVAPNRPAV